MSYSIKEIADKMGVTTAIKAGTENAVANVTSIAPTLEVDKIPKKYKEVNK